MSKIGKKPIALPSGVTLDVKDSVLTVKGAKGTLTKTLPAKISVAVDGNEVNVRPASEHPTREESAQWGLWRALVNNMLVGVSTGWETALEFQGVGYKAVIKGKDLELSLGYSHPIEVKAPEG